MTKISIIHVSMQNWSRDWLMVGYLKKHWSFYFKLVDLLKISEKQTECDQFEFLFDSFPPYSLHQIGLRWFTSELC